MQSDEKLKGKETLKVCFYCLLILWLSVLLVMWFGLFLFPSFIPVHLAQSGGVMV